MKNGQKANNLKHELFRLIKGKKVMKINVGSTNPAKLRAVEQTCEILGFKVETIQGFSVDSQVSDQPMSDEETLLGATNRAKAALSQTPDADYGIGLEGGIQKVGDRYFEAGWMAVVDKQGKMGFGSSARYELPLTVMDEINKGKELAIVIDEMTGLSDVRSKQGAMGIVTNGALPRDAAYVHGLLFAFGPFISNLYPSSS